MTRKDYVIIARAIKFAVEETSIEDGTYGCAVVNRDSILTIQLLVNRLCGELYKDNYNFDKERFIEACGL